jgi:YD repeat-containing protein
MARTFNVLTLLIALAAPTIEVSAQGRTFYGADGKPVTRSTTDTQGTTTLYGSDGRVISRETNTRSGSTVYDGASGRVVGKITRDKR